MARRIVRMGPTLTTVKLLLMAMAWSRPKYKTLSLKLLQPFVNEGEITVYYHMGGAKLHVKIRISELESDFCSVRELGVDDIYRFDSAFVPELVIDGGGNIGVFSLSAHALYPEAKIVICEPVPANLTQIDKHLSMNGVKAEVLPFCIGGEKRKIQFFCREANQGSFDASRPYKNIIAIEVVTLDELLRIRPAKTILIKLDIEGMELEVLESFVRLETRSICIVGELHDHKQNMTRLENIFLSAGWSLQFYDESEGGSIFKAYSRPGTLSNGQ
jgi:FkbM family methyltransferase